MRLGVFNPYNPDLRSSSVRVKISSCSLGDISSIPLLCFHP
nr:MAG TPA: hypothetical protein [Caudoviricetes sp.]